MNTSFDTIDEVINRLVRNIDRIEVQIHNYSNRINDLESLEQIASQGATTLCRDNGKVTLHLGDGWFVEQTADQVVSYTNRRIADFKFKIDALNKTLGSAKNGLNLFKSMKEKSEEKVEEKEENSKVNAADTVHENLEDQEEPGFPFMEIKEELDDNDNVISSSVGPSDKNHELKAFAQEHLSRIISQREEQFSGEKNPTKSEKLCYGPERPLHLQKKLSVSDRVIELEDDSSMTELERNEILVKPTGKDSQSFEKQFSTDHASDMSSAVPYESHKQPTIAKEDLLELELIANEFDEEDFEFDDGEYEFDGYDDDYDGDYDGDNDGNGNDDGDDEEEDEEEEEEDEDEFGRTRGTLFPFLSKSIVSNKEDSNFKKSKNSERKSISQNLVKEKTASESKVRFSETIEIKSFSTDPSESLISNGSDESITELVEHQAQYSDSTPVMLDIMERSSELTISDNITSDPIDNSFFSKTVVKENGTERPKASKFKKQRDEVKQSTANNTGTSKHSNTASTLSTKKSILKSFKPIALKQKENIPDYYSPSENVGDPDGPPMFSSDIYELAKMHFKESVLTEEDFLKTHDQSDMDEEDSTKENSDESRSILAENIVENASMLSGSYIDLDTDTSRREIAEEYQRLRKNLINRSGGFSKSQQELEREPIDEDGNPIKVSRFKAARLSNRIPKG